MTNIILFTLLSSLICGAAFIIGKIVLRLAKVSDTGTQGVFVCLCFGLSLIVSGYALWATRGNSVMLVLVPLMGGLLWNLRRNSPMSAEPTTTDWIAWVWAALLVLGGPALICLVRLPFLYESATGNFAVPYNDYVYYARFIFPLNELGVETYPSEPFVGVGGPQPYHYYDLWLNAMIVRLSGVSSTLCLYLSVYSALLAIEMVGFMVIIEKFNTSKIFALLLAIVGLCLTGVYFPVLFSWGSVKLGGGAMNWFPLLLSKTTPIYIFLCLGITFLHNGKTWATHWAWACIPVVFISTAPAVLASGVIVLLYIGWRQCKSLQSILQNCLPYMISALGVGAFYGLQPTPKAVSITPGMSRFVTQPKELLTAVNVLGGTVLQMIINFCPFLLLVLLALVFSKKSLQQVLRENETVLLFAGLAGVFGGVAYMAVFRFIDAIQFFSNIILPVLAIVIVLLLASTLSSANVRLRWGTIMILLGLTGYNWYSIEKKYPQGKGFSYHYDPVFLDQVSRLTNRLSPVGAFVFSEREYDSIHLFLIPSQSPGLYLTLLRNDVNLVSLSQIDVDSISLLSKFAHDSIIINNRIRNSAINEFKVIQLRQGIFMSDEAVKSDLIRQNHINFVCVSRKGELPRTLYPYVVRKLEDPLSGEKLFLLKN